MTTLTGMGLLVRLVVRRDRVRIPLWLLALVGVVVASAASLPPLYPDQQSIDDYVRLFGDNPALVAFAGPGHGFDDPNLGVILVNETQLWACIGFALMSIFLVNRHTRLEEDADRTELLRSSVVGRHAPIAAAVAVVSALNVVFAACCGLAFLALDYDMVGSIALAASFAVSGLAFTAITAAAAQLASGSRSTLGLATGVLGVSFVLRAVGDIGDNALRWLSPIGWAQGVRAYAGEQWWPIGLCVAASLAGVAGAFWLSTRRDLGSGILPQRPGPSRSAPWATHPIGLAVRLQRGSVIGWSIGLFIVGALYGSIGQDVEEMIEDNPAYADFLTQLDGVDLTDSFFATAMTMQALLAAGFAVSAALRMRSEEAAGHVEPILAAPVSRLRWVVSHLVVVVAGSLLVVGAGGVGIGTAYAVVAGETSQIPRLLGAALATVPAVLVLAGLAVALFGTSLRLALVAWVGVAAAVIIELFGEVLRLPTWSRAVSPLHHVPGLPAEHLRLLPIGLLATVALTLLVVGTQGFRSRDLQVG